MIRPLLIFRFEPTNPYHGVTLENVHRFDPRPYECPRCKVGLCSRSDPNAIVRMTNAPLKGVKGHPELKGKELWMIGVPMICNNPHCDEAEQIWPLGVGEEVKEILS